MFQGSIPAMITPFKDDQVDEKALRAFIQWQISAGSDALVPCGTTGESPTLSHEEHQRVTEIAIEEAKGKVPVIAGCGSNATAEAVALGIHAKSAGADAALVVTPYYNKPTQEGLYAHFKTFHDAVGLPVVIYNIPGRSIVDMSVETMACLAQLPHIIGVKDATADLSRPLLTRHAMGTDFCQLSGEDMTALPFLMAGGHGCISVTANVAPQLCANMHRAWRNGDIQQAMEIQFRLTPLHKALFCENSPAPSKYALSLLKHCAADVRLPLSNLSADGKKQVQDALRFAGILD